MLKHCSSLKTFIPNFVAFFVSLVVVISCMFKMSFSVTSARRELTPAGHCLIIHFPLVRDSEPNKLLVIPTSPNLYMLIWDVHFLLAFYPSYFVRLKLFSPFHSYTS